MDTEEWFNSTLEELKNDADFRLEMIILDLTEQISTRMKERGLTQTKLAKALGITPAAVTKILKGSPNFTLKSLLKVADALQVELNLSLCAKNADRKTTFLKPFREMPPLSRPFIPTTVSDALIAKKPGMVLPNYDDTEATGPLTSGLPSC